MSGLDAVCALVGRFRVREKSLKVAAELSGGRFTGVVLLRCSCRRAPGAMDGGGDASRRARRSRRSRSSFAACSAAICASSASTVSRRFIAGGAASTAELVVESAAAVPAAALAAGAGAGGAGGATRVGSGSSASSLAPGSTAALAQHPMQNEVVIVEPRLASARGKFRRALPAHREELRRLGTRCVFARCSRAPVRPSL